MGTIMEDRIDEVLHRLYDELGVVESKRTDLKQQISTLEYIRSGGQTGAAEMIDALQKGSKRILSPQTKKNISKAQKDRRAKEAAAKVPPNVVNNFINRWTEDDDKAIITAIRAKGKIYAPDFARILLSTMPNRTEGAIRQHLNRLFTRGLLRQTPDDTNSRTLMEVA